MDANGVQEDRIMKPRHSFQEEDARFIKRGRSGLERGLIFVAVAFFLAVIGLTVALVLVLQEDDSETSDVCVTDQCAIAASRVLGSLDTGADPCDDFYQFACGSWMKANVVPEDRSIINMFGVLRDDVQTVNKYLLEDTTQHAAGSALRKVKDMYESCVNVDLIEQRNISVTIPLLTELGGWPVLGSSPGGNWNETSFDLVTLLTTLRKYNNKPLIELYVGSDVKQSTQNVLYLDQPDFGLPGRTYYLEPALAPMRAAYVVLARSVAQQFGADLATAHTAMMEAMEFETEIANISMAAEDRRDNEALYNRMSIEELALNFTEPSPTDPIQFDWLRFVQGVMGLDHVAIDVNETEPVVVRAVPYFRKLFNVFQKYPKRVIANYLVWSIMQHRANNLPNRFQNLLADYTKVVYGAARPRARWRSCESYVVAQMGMAVGQLFVKEAFDESAKQSALDMIHNIRTAFGEILDEVDWMDDKTKALAKEKAAAMRNWIGYPDDILNNTRLDEVYGNVTADPQDYFQNVLNNIIRIAYGGLQELRKPYDKNVWSTPPSTVNAFYNSILNNIMFPAGILQPPFYDGKQPKSMNYGGIGVVIGHEITHGFDDRGRQYDKNGNLQQWWDQHVIDKFTAKAQCIVDQFGSYRVEEAGMNVNGINTQGENIADNGGLQESFRAYRHWVGERGAEEPPLPGLNFTHDQLFYVSFAQVWCSNSRKEAAIHTIQTGVHSPNRFRVIGALQNSRDFSHAFNCPATSKMNPEHKCQIW